MAEPPRRISVEFIYAAVTARREIRRYALSRMAIGFNKATANVTGLLVLWLTGCTATVHCPEVSEDPRPAFILEHGRHTTLALYDGGGKLLRYGYGDWRYYAEADAGFGPGVRAVLWPSPAAFGRQEYRVVAPTRAHVVAAVNVGIGEFHEVEVPGERVDQLRQALDDLFEQGARTRLLVNEAYDFVFVEHPRDYWFWYNSNHMVADWLESLGCEIRGPALMSVEVAG